MKKNNSQNCWSSLIIMSLLISLFFLLTNCLSEDDSTAVNSISQIRIETALLNPANDISRYSGSSYKSLSFIDGDEICMFVNGDNPNKWSLNKGTWESGSVIVWPDTTSTHNFHAFYPYNDKCTFDSIFAAPLSEQDGTLGNLYKYDLLIAKRSASHHDDNGIVSFTGDKYSFKHALSLLKINIKPTGELAQATINSLKISCPNLFSRIIHSFSEGKSYYDTTKLIEDITLCLEHNMNEVTKELFLITSPKESSSDITLTLKYSTKEEDNIVKIATLPNSTLGCGLIYQYNIQIKGGIIEVESPIITDWEEGNPIGDIYI